MRQRGSIDQQHSRPHSAALMGIASTRNFCIIAHIDHGKTTLSDRLLETTGTIHERDKQDQLLDSMDLERERGITIKAHPVTMRYKSKSGEMYRLNLLDTPGHVDFAYEVSRSLAACEGALLIVDAAQGVEAQTVANVHLAHKQGLTMVPVINKIDLPNADVPSVKRQLEEILAIPAEEAMEASAKMGIGIEEILEAIVTRIPPPEKPKDEILRALVFDSVFDVYRGVIGHVRVVSGKMEPDQAIKLMRNDARYEIKEVGVFTPKMYQQPRLNAGDVGYFIANIKTIADIKIGDTITDARNSARDPLPGFQEIHPMVFSGIYPINTGDFEHLKTAIAKLRLNDSALIYTPIAPRIQHGHHRHESERGLRSGEDGRRNVLHRQSCTFARPEPDQRNSRADRESICALPERKHRRHLAIDFGKARANGSYRDARHAPGDVALRAAAERDSGRF